MLLKQLFLLCVYLTGALANKNDIIHEQNKNSKGLMLPSLSVRWLSNPTLCKQTQKQN
jgi:hypothetical protein